MCECDKSVNGVTEICLLMKAKRVASVYAETYCNLFSLSVEHLNSVLDNYPVMRRMMESVAGERIKELVGSRRASQDEPFTMTLHEEPDVTISRDNVDEVREEFNQLPTVVVQRTSDSDDE